MRKASEISLYIKLRFFLCLLADRICNDFPLFLRLFVFHFHSRTLNFVLEPNATFQMIVRFFCLFFIQYFYLMHFFFIIRIVYDGFIGSLDKLYNLYTSLIMRNIAWLNSYRLEMVVWRWPLDLINLIMSVHHLNRRFTSELQRNHVSVCRVSVSVHFGIYNIFQEIDFACVV